MKIEAGKFYRTREGRKVGPMAYSETKFGAPFVWICDTDAWAEDGESGNVGGPFGGESSDDLIAEWTDPAPDYNDGNWHAWTGGGCPVHPQSVVELQRPNCRAAEYTAAEVVWGKGPLLFRVKSAYAPKVPEEAWRDDGGVFWPTREEALRHSRSGDAVLFREVLE